MDSPWPSAIGVAGALALLAGAAGWAYETTARRADHVPPALAAAALAEEVHAAESLGFETKLDELFAVHVSVARRRYLLDGGRCIAVILVETGTPAQPYMEINTNDARAASEPPVGRTLAHSDEVARRTVATQVQWCAGAGSPFALELQFLRLLGDRTVEEETDARLVVLEAAADDVAAHGGLNRGALTRAGARLGPQLPTP